ncbi:licH [Klebsiella pneumoniae subsp. rhinoscleromatis SB3432]|uniref:6-phospho-beta-glucosidase n=1 Tax=Klebsiella pneumoniae TaxID=573 RepID=UPI0001B7683A|nr:6-phospho-beta-glucosidase [Klebsiella pneumoniae]CCI76587.1 licH [Klebsiella pneumoniae subsp. rhinoscleromatis SB3432]STV45879.1 putative alpha-galactosidases/6-phospho-beta-glucosidases [Klebsiella pneumoniae subsp. rhinoscleromatis]EEW40808.1 family 4 glycosyl hydrolase [Klebsiella pneumoniae subsp. rhinoscleromatis ATCC 13884]STU45961.1 putative alpha-galactosidases/6-phospho-beta-glucosidases [Klebsiella pneumoniae]VTT32575.1 putative alpha-galactosidases/6-phospho-beta-glucosidases [
MSGLKIVVIGGGSSYTPELIEGLLNRYHEMPVASLWLVDIEEGKEKVEIIAGLAQRMIAKAGLTIEVVATLDRESALRDADFVCSQFRAGCLDARISDERISLKYGLIGQETNGLGGFANACRTIPIALEIAADMERLCPDAWLLNFTNPSGMVTEAILRHSRIKAVGLCNVPVIMQKGITTLLQCADEKEVVMQVAGLNHFIFVRQILHKGTEWLPEVIAEINAGRDPLVPRNIPPFRWPSHLLQGLGMIPCAYLRYYYMKDDLLRQELAEAGGEGTRGEVVKQLEKILFDQYRDPHLAVKPKALEGRGGQYYSEAACELMNAIYNDKRIIMHVNTRNNGAINGLPDDCAVEVSSLITASGPLPLNVAPFPEDTLRLLQLMKSFERLTIEAALTGNRHTAWRALMLNPLIVSGEKLELALDEVIAENRQWLPAFHA